MSDSLQLHGLGLQHARLPCPSPTPEAYSNLCPWSWWCHPTISSSVVPFSSHLKSFPLSGSFQWVGSLQQVAEVLEFQLQHQSFPWIFRTDFLEDRLVGSPCSPRDSQESSPTPQSPQFKSITVLNTTVQKHQFSGVQLSLYKALEVKGSILSVRVKIHNLKIAIEFIGFDIYY